MSIFNYDWEERLFNQMSERVQAIQDGVVSNLVGIVLETASVLILTYMVYACYNIIINRQSSKDISNFGALFFSGVFYFIIAILRVKYC